MSNKPSHMPHPGLIDSHFHLWRLARSRTVGNLSDSRLKDEILWPDYEAARDGTVLAGAVAVQVTDGDGEPEVEFFERAAAEHPALKAIVAWAPLEHEDVGAHLDRLVRHPLVAGIRRNSQYEPDPMFCAAPEFIAGAARLANHGLVCDVCVKHWQLDGVIGLARAVPQTTIILNHLGKPEIGADLAPWRESMSTLADLPNVYVKVSVVVHGAPSDSWADDDVAPVVAHVLAAFGPGRVLWGSNWPVAPLVTGYNEWLALAHKLAAHLDDVERAAIFHDNAARLYRIPA